MPVDKPLGFIDGRPVYNNAHTVCVVAAIGEIDGKTGLLAIRRVNNPGAGKIGLPGGYQMRGAPWQNEAVKELEEETGFTTEGETLTVAAFVTDSYLNNLVMCNSVAPAVAIPGAVHDDEVAEVIILDANTMDPHDWAFPFHFVHAYRTMQALEAGTPLDQMKMITTQAQMDAAYDEIVAEIRGRDVRPAF